MIRIKICTFNVRRFVSNDSLSISQDIVEKFKSLNEIPDILCLNEVIMSKEEQSIDYIAKELGHLTPSKKPFIINFFGHVRNVFGNAILLNSENFSLIGRSNFHLNGGSVITVNKTKNQKKTHKILRGMTCVEVEHNLGFKFKIACTHLDHIQEKERRIQLRHIEELLDFTKPLLLIGDLNALKRSDYSDYQLKIIEDRNLAHGWNPPEFGCLDIVENHGMKDSFELFHKGFLHSLPNSIKCTAHVGEEHQKYRVDYVYASAAFLNNFEVSNARLMKEVVSSDHYPLLIDFTQTQDSQNKL